MLVPALVHILRSCRLSVTAKMMPIRHGVVNENTVSIFWSTRRYLAMDRVFQDVAMTTFFICTSCTVSSGTVA